MKSKAARLIAVRRQYRQFRACCSVKIVFWLGTENWPVRYSMDWARLSPRGVRQMKHTMYLVVWRAIQWDFEWKEIYERLLPKKCRTDERTHQLIGREKVIGRLPGQMTKVIFTLLKQNHELLTRTEAGKKPPESTLYDREIHHQHRIGQYHPSRGKEEKSS